MRIIEQSHKILHMDSLDRIEQAGRTCYKSEHKVGCAAQPDMHCPHGTHLAPQDPCVHTACAYHTAHVFVKGLIKRGHEAMLEHGGATVRFVTNRGVTHELVRHRVASFGQESTRYVNYGGKEMEFIRPVWCDKSLSNAHQPYIKNGNDTSFVKACADAERRYNELIEAGWRPEQAREVLPNSLKTEIVVTTNYREWRHIFKLRAIGTTGKPHPQMQALMLPVLAEFKEKLPALFGDLGA